VELARATLADAVEPGVVVHDERSGDRDVVEIGELPPSPIN